MIGVGKRIVATRDLSREGGNCGEGVRFGILVRFDWRVGIWFYPARTINRPPFIPVGFGSVQAVPRRLIWFASGWCVVSSLDSVARQVRKNKFLLILKKIIDDNVINRLTIILIF